MTGPHFLQPLLHFALEFPPGWSVLNAADAVASQDPGGQAALVLQALASDRTLDQAIAEVRGQDPDVRFERFSVNGLPAARTRVEVANGLDEGEEPSAGALVKYRREEPLL